MTYTAEQIERMAERYTFYLDRYAQSGADTDWAMVVKIVKKATERGVIDAVVARSKALIEAMPSPEPSI